VPDGPTSRSALAARYREGQFGMVCSDGPGVTLCERRGLAIFLLDGPAGDGAFLAAIEDGLELELPSNAGKANALGARRAFWLAPGRWMVVAPRDDLESLRAALSVTLIGRPGALTELGQGRTVIRVAGSKKLDLLSKGCPLDLHPRIFTVGSCAQSLVAGIPATLSVEENGAAIDLYIMRSFGLALWDWLLEAGAEYGVEVTSALSPV